MIAAVDPSEALPCLLLLLDSRLAFLLSADTGTGFIVLRGPEQAGRAEALKQSGSMAVTATAQLPKACSCPAEADWDQHSWMEADPPYVSVLLVESTHGVVL